MPTFAVADAQEMRSLGNNIGNLLRGGDVLVLTGPLGAGKTTFVQGVARGLGISDAVTSPTFVVAREHKAGTKGIALVHVDAYRLHSENDFADLDLDGRGDAVVVVEWGKPFVTAITDRWIELEIVREASDQGASIEADDPAGGTRHVALMTFGEDWPQTW